MGNSGLVCRGVLVGFHPYFFLTEVIIATWNCRPQSSLFGGVDGDSLLFTLGQKSGNLCSSSGSFRVTLDRLISFSSLSFCICKRRVWASSFLWARNAWRRRSE